MEVPDDYKLKPDVNAVEDGLDFEAEILECSFLQTSYDDGVAGENWYTVGLNGWLESLKGFKMFFIWSTWMLRNILSLQKDIRIIDFLSDFSRKTDKLKGDIVREELEKNTIMHPMPYNPWLVNYMYFDPVVLNIKHPQPWSIN